MLNLQSKAKGIQWYTPHSRQCTAIFHKILLLKLHLNTAVSRSNERYLLQLLPIAHWIISAFITANDLALSEFCGSLWMVLEDTGRKWFSLEPRFYVEHNLVMHYCTQLVFSLHFNWVSWNQNWCDPIWLTMFNWTLLFNCKREILTTCLPSWIFVTGAIRQLNKRFKKLCRRGEKNVGKNFTCFKP